VDKHTFIIPAYRESPYLEECIQSLMNQTVRSRMLITTSTPSDWLDEIGDKYGVPVKVRAGERSIAQDWNFALSQAETELVTLAHQDDEYHPDYVKSILQSADRSPDTLILFTNNDLLINGQRVAKTVNLTIQRILLWTFRIRKHIRSQFVRRMTLSYGNPICCPSVTYHKKNLDRLPGGFAFDPTYPNNLDWEAWIRLARQPGAFVYEKDLLMTHRFHHNSETSASLAENKRQQDDRRMFDLLWPKPVSVAIAQLYALAYRSRHE